MVIIERQIQQVRSGKWTELEELDKKCTPVESQLGFPAKRRCRSLVRGLITSMLIIERQWEGLAVMEAAYEKALTDPEHRARSAEVELIRVDPFLTIEQVAERLNMGLSHAHNLSNLGIIPTIKLGKCKRVRYLSLMKGLEDNENKFLEYSPQRF